MTETTRQVKKIWGLEFVDWSDGEYKIRNILNLHKPPFWLIGKVYVSLGHKIIWDAFDSGVDRFRIPYQDKVYFVDLPKGAKTLAKMLNNLIDRSLYEDKPSKHPESRAMRLYYFAVA